MLLQILKKLLEPKKIEVWEAKNDVQDSKIDVRYVKNVVWIPLTKNEQILLL